MLIISPHHVKNHNTGEDKTTVDWKFFHGWKTYQKTDLIVKSHVFG